MIEPDPGDAQPTVNPILNPTPGDQPAIDPIPAPTGDAVTAVTQGAGT
ncbi:MULTISPECIES: hypothetical protein [unclassified Streptomyces]|nr:MULTISPECIES: hypothetical protein [unclassified Streptomyces]MCX5443803.1 hypothetical protein [Streptomyces sp. NBC_00063]WUB90859.1 hypothetical protein OHO83_00085 [Streptomyces sp. NBC_00569]WUB99180.1 hypothetical protein OHO83_46805 [Streptomyces sp. NBC_00569]